jgi:putative membrane protein
MMWLYDTPWWVWHIAMGVLFWLLCVALALAVTQSLRGRPGKTREFASRDGGILSALTILQERYARGEIGREEFLQKQRDLAVPS